MPPVLFCTNWSIAAPTGLSVSVVAFTQTSPLHCLRQLNKSDSSDTSTKTYCMFSCLLYLLHPNAWTIKNALCVLRGKLWLHCSLKVCCLPYFAGFVSSCGTLSPRTTTPALLKEFRYPHYTVRLFEASGMGVLYKTYFRRLALNSSPLLRYLASVLLTTYEFGACVKCIIAQHKMFYISWCSCARRFCGLGRKEKRHLFEGW